MVFDKIKSVLSGDSDLGDVASDLGAGAYAKYLEGVNFPIGKDDLIVALQDNGAQDAIVEHVKSLSQDRFDSPQDVFKTLTNR
jgi:hypothetical protein